MLLLIVTVVCNTSTRQYLLLCRHHESSSCLEFELSGYTVSIAYYHIVEMLKITMLILITCDLKYKNFYAQ